jgi:hypothetical protein
LSGTQLLAASGPDRQGSTSFKSRKIALRRRLASMREAVGRAYNAIHPGISGRNPLGLETIYVKTLKEAKSLAAKKPVADLEPEIEGSASTVASENSTLSTQIGVAGEICSADFGRPPRLSLVAATSAVATEIPPGQWALSNGLAPAVTLGQKIEIVPLTCALYWLIDFGQGEVGGVPIRFKTLQEVQDYGGTTTNELGKITFSRAMEIKCLLTGDYPGVPDTYLRLPLGEREYLVALYEPSRTAYRVVGVGLNLTLLNAKEQPWQRRWKLGVTTRTNRSLGSKYFVPTLEFAGVTSAAEQIELHRLVERQLTA